MNLEGKIALVTGAARVGKTVVESLAKHGAKLVLTYLETPDEVKEAVTLAKAAGGSVELVQANLAHAADVRKLVSAVRTSYTRLDVLVHMAANYPRVPWEMLGEQQWYEAMDVIAKSAYLLGKATGDLMRQNPGEVVVVNGVPAGLVKGKIIFFSDWSALHNPYKEYLPYNAAKSAVDGLTKSFAKELAPEILVNAVAPGPVLAPPHLSKEENDEVIRRTPLGRWGGAEEIAKIVLYLLDTDFVTGQVIPVDGGRSIR